MRGTEGWITEEEYKDRITPAHAGNSSAPRGMPSDSRDHPRTCGEQWLDAKSLHAELGSPPHMRGTANLLSCHSTPPGITPAHAGNRTRRRGRWGELRDHPRTCGEQDAAGARKVIDKGSPPHMRGTEDKLECFK